MPLYHHHQSMKIVLGRCPKFLFNPEQFVELLFLFFCCPSHVSVLARFEGSIYILFSNRGSILCRSTKSPKSSFLQGPNIQFSSFAYDSPDRAFCKHILNKNSEKVAGPLSEMAGSSLLRRPCRKLSSPISLLVPLLNSNRHSLSSSFGDVVEHEMRLFISAIKRVDFLSLSNSIKWTCGLATGVNQL